MQKHKLSKSTFTYGVQCLKRLFLHKHHKKLGIKKDPLSASQEARFSSGSYIGLLAQQKFPGGVDCSPATPYSYTESLLETEILVNSQKPCVVYEAAFQSSDGVLCAVDVLTCSTDPASVSGSDIGLFWDAYEVKSTKSVKEQHIVDAALQYWVMNKCGLHLRSINILHLNGDYKLDSSAQLNVGELFKVDDITEQVLTLQPSISEEVAKQLRCIELESERSSSGEVVVDIEDVLAHSCFRAADVNSSGLRTACGGGAVRAQPGAVMPHGLDSISIGKQCTAPYPCDFRGHCFGRVFGLGEAAGEPYDTTKSILNLSYGDKKWKFLHEYGIKRTTDIPVGLLNELSPSQQQQVSADQSGQEVVNRGELRGFLDRLQYPLHYLDFETVMPALPLYPGTGSYETLCVQYSLHIQPQPFSDDYSTAVASSGSYANPITHTEYLADHHCPADPTMAFMERLVQDLGEGTSNAGAVGSILVYSAYEVTRLREVAAKFPQYAAAVERICARVVDLATPFQKRHWYLPELDGKYSIKKVYPAVVPADRGAYAQLNIQEGLTATTAFLELLQSSIGGGRASTGPTPGEESIAGLRQSLLDYCRLDTWAMVRILESMAAKAVSPAEEDSSATPASAATTPIKRTRGKAKTTPKPKSKSGVTLVQTEKFSVFGTNHDQI
jgi:hypothetical protein